MGSNRVTVGSQLPAGTNNIGDVDVATLPAIPAGTNNIGDVDVLTLPGVAGDVAHDAADSGNPVKIGGKAIDIETMPTSVAAGDRVQAAYTDKGIAAVGLFDPVTQLPIETLQVTLTSVIPAGDNNIGNVDVASSALPTGAATEVTLAAVNSGVADLSSDMTGAAVSLAVMDDWDEADRAKVNPIAGQAGVAGGAGAVSALTQRVVLATDQTVIPVGDNGGSLTVDGTVAVSGTVTVAGAVTNAGTFAVQDSEKIADNAGFTDGTTKVQPIGYIFDEVAGTALTENDIGAARMNANRAAVGIIEDGATRARYATVSAANALKVDGSAVTQPVSGTVTINAIPAGSANIGDVDIASIAAGDNNIGNVDVVSLPAITGTVAVTGVATAANQSTVIGHLDGVEGLLTTIDADTGNLAGILTSVQTLDNAIAGTEMQVDVLTLPALVAGSAAIGKLAANSGVDIGDVDVTSLPNVTLAAGTNTNEVVGDVAEDVALAGNPVRQGVRASTAIPTAMSADNDIVTPWANRSGAQVVVAAPHVGLNSDPWNLVHEGAQYTTAQTSTVLVAGGASEKIVVTKVQIQCGGTVAGTLQLYFGTGAFARGTNRAIFDGEFAPSATSKPGVVMDGPFIAGTNGDDLMVTGVGAINPLTINVWYYVIT